MLYRTVVKAAFKRHLSRNVEVGPDHVDAVARAFRDFDNRTGREDIAASQLRTLQFGEASFICIELRSNRICLYCMASLPEHSLTCGHIICDNCLRIFGSEILNVEHHLNLRYCILCTDNTFVQARLKLPTAGVRMLTVDGGGIRGVIPLQFLSVLQESFGVDMNIQDLFDAAYGTSAGKYRRRSSYNRRSSTGGWIVLGLVLQGWDVSTCNKNSTKLGQQLFAAKRKAPWRWLSRRAISSGAYYQMISMMLEHWRGCCRTALNVRSSFSELRPS